MSFAITPSNINSLGNLFRDPRTGLFTVPSWTYSSESNDIAVNKDPRYQKKVVVHIKTCLKEKWLYTSQKFKKLLKYFDVKSDDNKCVVTIKKNSDNTNKEKLSEKQEKCILRSIEKMLISKKFVEKTLRRFIKKTGYRWFDMFYIDDILQQLFADKMEKHILTCIHNISD